MRPGGVFPPEMPDEQPERGFPLDDDTAERLLAGRLDPEDAPPGYAEVARLLRAAAGPPSPDELAGEEATLARFRASRPGRAPVRARHGTGGEWSRPGPPAARARRGRSPARARLVALALAGTLVAGGVWTGAGVWIADGARTAFGLRSPSGGPGTGGSGSGAPGPGPGSGAAGGAGSLRPATTPVTGGRTPALPLDGERPTALRGHGVGSQGGGAGAAGAGAPKVRPPKPKPSKPKPPNGMPPKAGKARPGEAKPPTARPSGKATQGQQGHRCGSGLIDGGRCWWWR